MGLEVASAVFEGEEGEGPHGLAASQVSQRPGHRPLMRLDVLSLDNPRQARAAPPAVEPQGAEPEKKVKLQLRQTFFGPVWTFWPVSESVLEGAGASTRPQRPSPSFQPSQASRRCFAVLTVDPLATYSPPVTDRQHGPPPPLFVV